jgi:predicted acylesterase/phospholipase RssA
LALDGGGAKGLITAIVIKEIEKFAREYATEKNYNVPVLKNE